MYPLKPPGKFLHWLCSGARAAATMDYKLGASTTEIYGLTALEAESPKSREQWDWVILQGENLPQASLFVF